MTFNQGVTGSKPVGPTHITQEFLVIGNWKMCGTATALEAFCAQANPTTPGLTAVICPPFPYLDRVARHLPKGYALGAQDCSAHKEGAHTSQISAAMLRDNGCHYVLIGHSECQLDHDTVITKAERALEAGLIPLVCVGEKNKEAWLQEITPQLNLPEGIKWLAYEPCWAIGGTTLPDAHHLTQVLSAMHNYFCLYGGGVDQHTLPLLLERAPHLSGILVGRASRDPATWNALLSDLSVLLKKRSL